MRLSLFNRDPEAGPESSRQRLDSGLAEGERVSPTTDARSPPDTARRADAAALLAVSYGSRLNEPNTDASQHASE